MPQQFSEGILGRLWAIVEEKGILTQTKWGLCT